jgi:hypothetical protein
MITEDYGANKMTILATSNILIYQTKDGNCKNKMYIAGKESK